VKKILMLALLAGSFEVHAEACPSMDYEEIKDMDTKELTATYCSFHKEWQSKLLFSIAYRDEDSLALARKCEAQVQRIGRLLKKRDDGGQAIIDTCPMAY
jgi:hypothetical protein